MYRRINAARDAAPELSSPSRYFLNQHSGGIHDTIFAVARWIAEGNTNSVVLVFVNLLTDQPNAGLVCLASQHPACWPVHRLQPCGGGSLGSVWPEPRSAEDIYEAGIYVQFSYPNEVQFLSWIVSDFEVSVLRLFEVALWN